jgi:hypothetical protein
LVKNGETARSKRKSQSKKRKSISKERQPKHRALQSATVSMAGSIAPNLHEGSRSEYLAQYVFSSFGTAIPVQEDSGLDIYCTLLKQQGKRAWPRAYYSVQVKSTMALGLRQPRVSAVDH